MWTTMQVVVANQYPGTQERQVQGTASVVSPVVEREQLGSLSISPISKLWQGFCALPNQYGREVGKAASGLEGGG